MTNFEEMRGKIFFKSESVEEINWLVSVLRSAGESVYDEGRGQKLSLGWYPQQNAWLLCTISLLTEKTVPIKDLMEAMR